MSYLGNSAVSCCRYRGILLRAKKNLAESCCAGIESVAKTPFIQNLEVQNAKN